MDLTRGFPRSPKEKLGGLVWLPRLIDKAKAALAGKLGDYRYNCPMDERFFAFLGLRADEFLAAVRDRDGDAAVLEWVQERAGPLRRESVAEFNRDLAGAGPHPGKTYFSIIDAEEGRSPD